MFNSVSVDRLRSILDAAPGVVYPATVNMPSTGDPATLWAHATILGILTDLSQLLGPHDRPWPVGGVGIGMVSPPGDQSPPTALTVTASSDGRWYARTVRVDADGARRVVIVSRAGGESREFSPHTWVPLGAPMGSLGEDGYRFILEWLAPCRLAPVREATIKKT